MRVVRMLMRLEQELWQTSPRRGTVSALLREAASGNAVDGLQGPGFKAQAWLPSMAIL